MTSFENQTKLEIFFSGWSNSNADWFKREIIKKERNFWFKFAMRI